MMKRLPRKPRTFGVMDLAMMLSDSEGFSLTDPDASERFLEAVKEAFTQNQGNEILLHGKRVESMFAFVANSLGAVNVIREEDSGETYATESDLLPPDYRVLLKNGQEFLVEVKNYHQADARGSYVFKTSYLEKLRKYSRPMAKDLISENYRGRKSPKSSAKRRKSHDRRRYFT